MEQRRLGGQTGLRVSTFALGTGRLGTDRDGGSDPAQVRRALDLFVEAGGTFIDTSSAYQQGQAETILGGVLAAAGRDRFVIASKYGLTALADPPASLVGQHRKAIRVEVEGSLKRLRTDYIDIYMPHFDDGATPIEETLAGLDDLVRAGKVVHLGLSNFPAWRAASAAVLAELRGLAPLSVLQLGYGLLSREAEREHLPLAEARGLGVMGYSPLAGGMLAQRLRARAAGHGGEDPVADALHDIAIERSCDPTAVAIAWVAAKGIVPILGPRGPGQLAEGLAAVELRLSPDEVASLDRSSHVALGQPYDLLAQVRHRFGLAPSTASST